MSTAASPSPQGQGGPDSQVDFCIPLTGPPSRPRRTLKHGDTFAVIDSHGDIGASIGGPDGIFHSDTRFLSRLDLLIEDTQPLLLGSVMRDDNSVLTVDLTNPDIFRGRKLILPKDTVHIVRTVFVWRGTVYERFGLRNYGDARVLVHLSLAFANDFADVFEVRGVQRLRRGTASAEVDAAGQVVLRYCGLDGGVRHTVLTFDPAPLVLEADAARYEIGLRPRERRSIFIAVTCDAVPGNRPLPFLRSIAAAARERRAASFGAASVETSNDLFNQVLCRSSADIRMLVTDTPDGPYPYAGIPWYSTTFGRDGLITAIQLLWSEPDIAVGVLNRLAAHQAARVDPGSDAEPGKILHEMRAGEMAALGEIPFGLYYGSVDSTPLFIMLAGLYVERTGDAAMQARLWPHVEAALRWIDEHGDLDGDGFVEYRRMSDRGLINQGWKDSQDSVFHADGALAEGPIALIEVQAYVYAAKRLAARMARRLGYGERAIALVREADELATRFHAAFWSPELGTYALALDGRKRPCRVRTSNAGHALLCGIAPTSCAVQVAEGLLRPDLFSGWGVRTLSAAEQRYNPMSYHNGSVWPHDNALIAMGFARYNLSAAVERVFEGLFEAATYMDLSRLPELFCGFRRARGRGPTLYPVACSPQAWAAAAPFALLQASLGLQFNPPGNEIRLVNPRLPPFLDEVIIRNLRLNRSSLDLAIGRRGEQVSLHVLRRNGRINVSAIHT